MIKQFVIPLVLVAGALLMFFFVTQPILTDIDVVKAEQTTLNNALDSAKELKTLGTQLVSKFNAISPEDKTRLDKMLPDSIDNVRLIIDIDNIASKYGMAVRNVRVKTDADPSGNVSSAARKYGSVSLGFNVSGSYSTLRLFLNDLETSLRLIDVTSLSFSSSDRDMSDYSVELRTYWLKK